MKIYLAARYSRREELCKYREELKSLGHEVTSSWLDTTFPSRSSTSSNCPAEEAPMWAATDLIDISDSSIIINFTDGPNSGGKGGRHVEFGFALSTNNAILLVGPRENVFHHLPRVQCFGDWTVCLEWIKDQYQ